MKPASIVGIALAIGFCLFVMGQAGARVSALCTMLSDHFHELPDGTQGTVIEQCRGVIGFQPFL